MVRLRPSTSPDLRESQLRVRLSRPETSTTGIKQGGKGQTGGGNEGWADFMRVGLLDVLREREDMRRGDRNE